MKDKYNIVYADPPWNFSSKCLFLYQNERFKKTLNEHYYKTQSKAWIKKLPVNEITHKDCALFLWSTDAHMKEAIEVMEAWGFKYKTVAFIWEKLTRNGKTCANLGSWTMKNYEICLLGTKGKMLQYKKQNNIYQKVAEERTKHSKKPYKVRKNIESLFGDLPRIELFAREHSKGWDVWGDEV